MQKWTAKMESTQKIELEAPGPQKVNVNSTVNEDDVSKMT